MQITAYFFLKKKRKYAAIFNGTVQVFCPVMRIMAEFINPHVLLHAKCDLNNYGC